MASNPAVLLALASVGDAVANLQITPSNLSGHTLLKAMIVLADEKNKPNMLNIVDRPAFMENGIQISAKNDFSNLKAGNPVTVAFIGLTNGVKHNAKVQLLLKKDSDGSTRIVEGALATHFTPSGAPSAPVVLSTVADSDDDSKFTVRIARHSSDGGSPIANVVYYLSKPDDGKGNVINSIITKIVDYSSMYQSDADGNYPQYLETVFDATDGIAADSNYELAALFHNLTTFGPLSDAVMTKSRNTPNQPTSLIGSGSDGQVLVNGTAPNNNFIAPIRGLIAYDQNATEADRLAPIYYAFDGANFNKVVDMESMGPGFRMKDNAKFSFVIDKLLNNVAYIFKVNFVSTNGKGDASVPFDVKAKKAPSLPNKHKAARYTPTTVNEINTFSTSQQQIDSSSRYARVTAVKFTWEDPLENWATSSTKYTSSLVSADAKPAAIEMALIRFIQPANLGAPASDDARTPSEKLLTNDVVLQMISNLTNTITLTLWSGYTLAQKLTACGNSVQMREALTIYFNVIGFVKSQADALPVDITDNISASQEWSRVVYTVVGAKVNHSVTASIVDNSALITSPASLLEVVLTDAINEAQPNIASTKVVNGDIEISLDRVLRGLGWLYPVYNFIVTTTTGQQMASFTPQYDIFGYAKKSTVMIGRDLGIGLTNGVPVTVSVGTEPIVDPVTNNSVAFARNNTGSITPYGKTLPPKFSTRVDKLNLRMQIAKPESSDLNGATLSKMGFVLVKVSDLPPAQALNMTTTQLDTYYAGVNSPLKLELFQSNIDSGLSNGSYRPGYDYLISSADATAKLTYGHSLGISSADGNQYYVLYRLFATVSSSDSDWAISEPVSFYNNPSPVTSLVAKNNNGAFDLKWTVPVNDGNGSALGEKILNYNIDLMSGTLKVNTYTSPTNAFTIPSADTNIGQVYTVVVTAVNTYLDGDGKNLLSSSVTSSTVTAATKITLGSITLNADARGAVIPFVTNGATLEKMLFIVALNDGSDKHFDVPSARLNISPINISSGDLVLSAGQTIVSALAVAADSTANGLSWVTLA